MNVLTEKGKKEAALRDELIRYLKTSRTADFELSEKAQELMLRLDYADDIMRNNPTYTPKEFIETMVKKYDYTHTQARTDLQMAQYVHGTFLKPVKAYQRMLMIERLNKLLEKLNTANKHDLVIKCEELLMKLGGLDQLDDDIEVEESAARIIIQPAFIPEQLGVKLPDNIDELMASIQTRVKATKDINNSLNG